MTTEKAVKLKLKQLDKYLLDEYKEKFKIKYKNPKDYEKRFTKRIKLAIKLYIQLQPIIEETLIGSGRVDSLSYELFKLETTTPRIDFKEIYQGSVKQDRRFQSRRTQNGWNGLINKITSGEI